MSKGWPVGSGVWYEQTDYADVGVGPDALILFGERGVPEGFPALLKAKDYQVATNPNTYTVKLDARYYFVLEGMFIKVSTHYMGENIAAVEIFRQQTDRAFQTADIRNERNAAVALDLLTSPTGDATGAAPFWVPHYYVLQYAAPLSFIFAPAETLQAKLTWNISDVVNNYTEVIVCGRYIRGLRPADQARAG